MVSGNRQSVGIGKTLPSALTAMRLATVMSALLLAGCIELSGSGGSETGGSSQESAGDQSSADDDTSSSAAAPQVLAHHYNKNDGPPTNPMKGWNAGWWNEFPETSVGFQYVQWQQIEPEKGQFDFDEVENLIDRPGSRDRHLILRLYCDWHGEEISQGCPSWLFDDVGVGRIQGVNQSGEERYLTDFNDPRFIEYAEKAIAGFAAHYDDDPRIYAVQVGMLGHWGEWHNFGFQVNGESYQISDAAGSAMLNAYRDHFDKAQVMARYPWREPAQTFGGLGFHNDYFVAFNGHSDDFDEAITVNEHWRQGPIGGEAPPLGDRDPSDLFQPSTADVQQMQGMAMIEAGHYSTMKPGAYRPDESDPHFDDYMKMHRRMGYNYQIDQASFPTELKQSQSLALEIDGFNTGVAPFYFEWDVEFALLDVDLEPVRMTNIDTDLTTIMPEQRFAFLAEMDVEGLNPGDYSVAVRIVQPGATETKPEPWRLNARNTYILFANDLATVEGRWGNQHELIGGWSVLGDVEILAN